MRLHFVKLFSTIFATLLASFAPHLLIAQLPLSTQSASTFHFLFGHDRILDIYADNFLSSLKKQLSDEGIDTIVYMAGQTTDADIANSDLLITLESTQSEPGGKVRPSGWPLHDKFSAPSSMLYNTFQGLPWNIAYDQDDQTASQAIIDFTTGLSLYALHRCDLADKYFTRFQNAVPKLDIETGNLQAGIGFYRGNCALIAGDFETAAHFYETSRSLIKRLTLFTDASAVNLAWVDVKLGRSDDAFQLMDAEVARFNPQNSLFTLTALEQRSQLHALAFQYDAAVSDLDLAIQYCMASPHVTQSYCASFYTLRGQTYLLLYEWDNVLADYNKALELDPSYADAYYYRGVLKYSVLQTGASLYTEALADFQRYLDLVPTGEHAADATRYATDIQTQLAALNN